MQLPFITARLEVSIGDERASNWALTYGREKGERLEASPA
jgi:hypothetical protein